MAPADDLIYRVDARDRVTFVNEVWDHFATANHGDSVVAERVVGRSLWDFITDRTTRLIYRQVFERIRSGRSVRFTFRCDAPSCRRLLEMSITAVGDGALEFRNLTLSIEDREPIAVLDAGLERTAELLRVCGWCNRVDVDGDWMEVEEAVGRLQLFESFLPPTLTHGMCPDCFARVTEDLLAN